MDNEFRNDPKLTQLIADCKQGSRRAQHKLFKTYYGQLLGVCMRYAGSSDEAEDMLSEGFLKIFSNLGQYEETGSFEAWMKRVITHAAIDYQRRYKTLIETVEYENISEVEIQRYDVNTAIEKISGDELMQLIQELPPMSRTVFNLYIFENYSHSEIAEMLNIKEGTSHWHLNFARNTLKEKINNIR